MPSDAELRAIVALRCVQAEYQPDAALEALRSYACSVGVSGRYASDAVHHAVMQLATFTPGALPAYLRKMGKVRAGEDTPARSTDPNLFTVLDAAAELGVTPRTVYRWINSGHIEPADTEPYLFERAELERLQADRRPVIKAIKSIRMCSYGTARKWVWRRRKGGLSDDEIIQEARSLS
ncbi:MAG: helix-turn-helix domain-containing protein [Gemmatimonadota bacterium]